MPENQRSERNREAIQACAETREDARLLLARINEGDTYFDRPEHAPDVDVTSENAKFFQTVINRMDVALAALEACDA